MGHATSRGDESVKLFSGIQQRYVVTVMSLLVLLTIAVSWSFVWVSRRNTFKDAAYSLQRDSLTFKTLYDHRTSELYTRARLLAGEPRVIAALGTPDIDRPTVQFLTEEIRADGELDLLMLQGTANWPPAFSMKGVPLEDGALRGLALPDSPGAALLIASRDVHVVSAPVTIGGAIYGYMMIGDFLRETHFQAIRPLIASDIILCATGDSDPPRIVAASLPVSEPDRFAILSGSSAENTNSVEMTIPSSGDQYLVRRVSIGSGIDAIFLKSLEPARAAVHAALKLSILIASCFLLISALIVNFMSKSITRPILKLVRGTESLAGGNFDTQTDIQSPDELRFLSQAFNGMAKWLKAMVVAEERARASLEERVKERTKELVDVNRLLGQAHQQLKDQTSKMIQYEKLAGIGTLTGGITHELNNPLVVILGNSQILCDTVTDPWVKRKSDAILKHARRCADIVQNMIRFSRQEEPKPAPVDIHALIDRAMGMAKIGSGFDRIQIVRNYDAGMPPVMLDASLMEQVVMNISTNAFQSIRDDRGRGTVTVSTTSSTDRIFLRFKDDGPGMTPEVASKIFDPFFTTKVVGKGIGLGLSVAHGIVIQHGGRIFVERSDSTGTTIAVELPAAAAFKGCVTGS